MFVFATTFVQFVITNYVLWQYVIRQNEAYKVKFFIHIRWQICNTVSTIIILYFTNSVSSEVCFQLKKYKIQNFNVHFKEFSRIFAGQKNF